MKVKPRILVIGGAGFIGRHLTKKLLQQGFSVSVLDLFKNDQNSIDWMIGSISDETLVSAAASGCETVMYLASSSLPATANLDIAAEINQHVKIAVKAAEISCYMNVKKFIFASSGGTVYGFDSDRPILESDPKEPRNAYGVSKLTIENYLSIISRFRDIKTISLRISNPYGEFQQARHGQGFIAAGMRAAFYDEPLSIWGDGSVVRDFLHVNDVADAFILAHHYDGPSGSFNIGSSIGRSLIEVIKCIENATGKAINTQFETSRLIDVKKSILDIQKAEKFLQWTPSTNFENGLKLTSQWWSDQVKVGS